MCGDARSAARRLAWERLARSLLSCVSSPADTPAPMPTATDEPTATASPYPTGTPYPTYTPVPTYVPPPTYTRFPSLPTLQAKATLWPTPTKLPPLRPTPTSPAWPTRVPTATATAVPPPPPTPTRAPAATPTVTDMVARVSQSVVHIASDSGVGTGFFIQDVSVFYGVESADKIPERFTALNSRFVLTNYHVVEGDREVMVRHPNRPTVLLGVVIAVEPVRDLAIVQVCCFTGRLAQWDPALPWGDASRIRPGAEVFAIGYLTADVRHRSYSD